MTVNTPLLLLDILCTNPVRLAIRVGSPRTSKRRIERGRLGGHSDSACDDGFPTDGAGAPEVR